MDWTCTQGGGCCCTRARRCTTLVHLAISDITGTLIVHSVTDLRRTWKDEEIRVVTVQFSIGAVRVRRISIAVSIVVYAIAHADRISCARRVVTTVIPRTRGIALVLTGIPALIAAIIGARVSIVAIHRRAYLTVQVGVTGLHTSTVQPIVTQAIRGHIVTGIRPLVAAVHRAAHPVAAVYWRARLTGPGRAGFGSVAELPIIAVRVHETSDAGINILVTDKGRSAWISSSWLAVQDRIAGLGAVAVLPVVAQGVTGYVLAAVRCLVTRVHRAAYPVAAVYRRSGLAGARVAVLCPVAEIPIVAARRGERFLVNTVSTVVIQAVADLCCSRVGVWLRIVAVVAHRAVHRVEGVVSIPIAIRAIDQVGLGLSHDLGRAFPVLVP
jgi:hypothetical protein